MIIRGTVKWFNDAKGFGFINHEKGDVFVHFSAIEIDGFKTLKDGEEVQYELSEGPKGLNATKVMRLSAENMEDAASSVRGLASMIEKEVIPPQEELQAINPEDPQPEQKLSK